MEVSTKIAQGIRFGWIIQRASRKKGKRSNLKGLSLNTG